MSDNTTLDLNITPTKNVLKYSIPEYITNDEDLFNKITKISKADLKNGGEGAIFVHLKQSKKATE